MKITADNRGRIALGKLDKLTHYKMGVATLPGSEWDVELKDCQLIVKPVSDEPVREWKRVGTLEPEHVGQVVWVKSRDEEVFQKIETLEEFYTPKGLCGVLEEFYSETGHTVSEIRMMGGQVQKLKSSTVFWVKA